MTGPLTWIFAIAAGLAVANLYYAQPLLGTMAASFGVAVTAAGLVVTMTQLGYSFGLLMLAPLGDLVENRRLINLLLGGSSAALLAAASCPSLPAFAVASLAIGITSVVVQVLVPFAAALAPPASRGQVVGQVMSGLLTGILLARAVAGLVAGALGWRAVYGMSAILMIAMNLVLYRLLPQRKPDFTGSYIDLIRSLGQIFWRESTLRRRAAYQSAMFASFSAFWTCTTFLLAAPPYRLSQTQIGLFALSGALGAVMAPIAGGWGDKGYGRVATGGALLMGAAAFALTLVQPNLWIMVLGAILLDAAVQTTLVLGQQAVFSLNPAQRNRLNTLYIATFFLGGAGGSALSSWAYHLGGWTYVSALGAGLPLAAFLLWLTEPRKS